MTERIKRVVYDFAAEGALLLAKEGVALAKIVLPCGAGEKEKAAAAELKKRLDQMTGGDFPLICECDAKGEETFIYVGLTKFAQSLGISFGGYPGNERVIIRNTGKALVLCGNDAGVYCGSEFAVNRFLEEAGCGFFAEDALWEVVPNKPTLSVGAWEMDHKPRFVSRQISGLGALGNRWFLGGDEMITGHGLPWFANKDVYYKTNPEFFALVGDSRDPNRFEYWQYCYTNEQLAETVAKNIGEYFDKTPSMISFPLPAQDGWNDNWCECENCRHLTNHSDQIMILANRIGKILQKTHPDRFISILSYHSTYFPPSIPAEKNVEVMFCTETSPFLPLDEGHLIPGGYNKITRCTYTKSWRDNYMDYVKAADVKHPTIWCWYCIGGDYPAWRDVPWVQGEVITRNLKLWEDFGATRIFFDGGQEKKDLRWPLFYAAARGMWAKDYDAESLLLEACERLFGPAAEEMFAYYQMLAKQAAACKSEEGITWLPCPPEQVYTDEAAIERLVKAALAKKELLSDVQKARMDNQFGYWEITKKTMKEGSKPNL